MAKTRILIRIRRVSLGNLGDAKPVGEGVSELRIDYGAGYRVYFVQSRENACGVARRWRQEDTQPKDIRRAIALSKTV